MFTFVTSSERIEHILDLLYLSASPSLPYVHVTRKPMSGFPRNLVLVRFTKYLSIYINMETQNFMLISSLNHYLFAVMKSGSDKTCRDIWNTCLPCHIILEIIKQKRSNAPQLKCALCIHFLYRWTIKLMPTTVTFHYVCQRYACLQ